MGDYNSIEAVLFVQKKNHKNSAITKIPEKKTEIFINLESLRFPSIAVSVLKTRTVQNLQNFPQNYF